MALWFIVTDDCAAYFIIRMEIIVGYSENLKELIDMEMLFEMRLPSKCNLLKGFIV